MENKKTKLGLSEIRKLLPKEKYVVMNEVFNKVLEDGIITMTPQEKKVYKYRQLPVNYYHNKIEWVLMKKYCSLIEHNEKLKEEINKLKEDKK